MSSDPLLDPDWALLARYFAGEASRTDTDRIGGWLAVDPERRVLADHLRHLWQRSAELLPHEDVEAALQQIKMRGTGSGIVPLGVAANVPVSPAEQQPPHASPRHRRLPAMARWSQAAAALLVLGAGALLWRVLEHGQVAAVSQATRTTDVATKRSERAWLRLPDGSKIVLGPESRLRFAATFGMARRDLYLEGEAYIEAVHDEAKPLRVYAGGVITKDVGTAFVVRAYPGSRVQVAVSEGAVLLESRYAGRPQQVVLTPAERGTVQSDGSVVHERGIAVAQETAWVEGRLVFADTPLREAIPRLNRWYDLDIHLADAKLGDLRLNATFEHETASEVLQLVGLILDLGMERHGSSVVFHRKRSHL